MNLLNIEVMQYGVRRKKAGNIMNDDKEIKFRVLQCNLMEALKNRLKKVYLIKYLAINRLLEFGYWI